MVSDAMKTTRKRKIFTYWCRGLQSVQTSWTDVSLLHLDEHIIGTVHLIVDHLICSHHANCVVRRKDEDVFEVLLGISCRLRSSPVDFVVGDHDHRNCLADL
jgi:hypothetical protein